MDRLSMTSTTSASSDLLAPATFNGRPAGLWLLRFGRFSLLLDRRAWLASLLLLLATIVLIGLSLGSGTVKIAPFDALAALFNQGETKTIFIVRDLRLTRVLGGGMAGAALGMAGCLLQTLSRNRLANPDTIGIDNAATAFAVASVVGVSTTLAPSAMALTGAITMLSLTFALSGGAGTRGYRFLITGLGLGAICGAATNLMLARAPIDAANTAFPWTVGSLNNRSGVVVTLLAWGVVVMLPLATIVGKRLNLVRLPDAVAQSLGVRVNRLRFFTIVLAGSLTGLAVAVAGPVGMIGLAAPELGRRLAGPRTVPIIPAALAGACFTMLADLLGRTLFSPTEIPVGIVTALVGGPYLLWFLLRTPRGKQL
ncbi:FecCD family ABC transporter permease [Herpetosiphon llansteffanensis]|uniref:FecCD family ABC transporter permease n=1 Tax=Herpetosiphon llansteffanensis TaxID=2094568 RepID=UPI000D7B9443|nr:iron ABC transporter permease [Herpetosiphon llansteffanensis]